MLSRIVSTPVMPKATTTAPIYTKKLTKNGTSYRVRTNKRGVPIVALSFELPEADFLHHEELAHRSKQTVAERVIALLAQN